MNFIGIDPGLTGAIAVLYNETVEVFDMPTVETGRGVVKREVDAVELARLLRPHCDLLTTFAALETTAARPGQGVASMFSMGVSRGVVLGVLAALHVTPLAVAPATWKRHFDLLHTDKGASLTEARFLFPSVPHLLARVKDHNRAEALLIAAYLRETLEAV